MTFSYTKYISYNLTPKVLIILVGFTEPGLSEGKGEKSILDAKFNVCQDFSDRNKECSDAFLFFKKKSRLMQNRKEKIKILNKDEPRLFILLPYANLGFVSSWLDYLKYRIKNTA